MRQGSTRTNPGRDAASAAGERAGANHRAEGTRRSARLAVPKPDTSISLGSMVPGTPIKVNGFGLDTVAQGYVNACGQLGIQSAQELYVQSTGRSVCSHAGRDQIVAAGNNAYLFGRGGVLVATVDRDPTAVDAETNMPRGTGVDEARADAGPAAESVAAFREMIESAPDARRGRDDRSNQGSYRPFAPWRQTVSDFSGFLFLSVSSEKSLTDALRARPPVTSLRSASTRAACDLARGTMSPALLSRSSVVISRFASR